jgi:hypothetical protein
MGAMLCLVSAAALTPASADEGPPPQSHTAAACKANDPACVKAWFVEYRAGIAEEFRFYESIATTAHSAAQSGNVVLATSLTREMIEGRWYRHNHWDILTDPGLLAGTDISYDDLEAVDSDCRDSIIELKYFVIAATDGKYDADGWKAWNSGARKCRAYLGRQAGKKKAKS